MIELKTTILTKIFTQTLMGIALSFIYMQIRPYESYTLAWPFAFLASWFLLWGWIAYLKYDRLSIFDVTDRYKKQIEDEERIANTVKLPSFMNYVYTPIAKSDPAATKTEVLKTRMISNFVCCVFFGILAVIL